MRHRSDNGRTQRALITKSPFFRIGPTTNAVVSYNWDVIPRSAVLNSRRRNDRF